nr:uncharacterized protein LOC131763723 isoform X2 [Kogia breviceps]
MRDRFTSQKQACWQEHLWKETAAQVAWNISYGHKHLKEGPLPRKQLQKATFRSVWEWGHPRPPATCWMARDQGAPGSAVQGSRCPGPSTQGRQSQAGPKSNSRASRPDQTRGLRHEAGPPAPCSCSSKASPSTAKARPPIPPGSASAEARGEVSILGVQLACGNYLGIALKCRFGSFIDVRGGVRFCISHQLPDNADAVGPWTTLEYQGCKKREDLQPTGIWGASSALGRTLEVFTVEHWDGWGITRQGEKCDEGKSAKLLRRGQAATRAAFHSWDFANKLRLLEHDLSDDVFSSPKDDTTLLAPF